MVLASSHQSMPVRRKRALSILNDLPRVCPEEGVPHTGFYLRQFGRKYRSEPRPENPGWKANPADSPPPSGQDHAEPLSLDQLRRI
jgi:hypothetical protein